MASKATLDMLRSLHEGGYLAADFQLFGVPTTEEEAEVFMAKYQGIRNQLAGLEEMNYAKVYKRNGMNCVDLNGTCTYLPDDLSLVPGIWVGGEYYSEVVTVQTSV